MSPALIQINMVNTICNLQATQVYVFSYSIIHLVPPFVPSDYVPSTVSRYGANTVVSLLCPFKNAGNPPPLCTWNRLDNNNISHQLEATNIIIFFDNTCYVWIKFTEADNGLYQCTGHNEFGNVTYTFPEKFIVESKR